MRASGLKHCSPRLEAASSALRVVRFDPAEAFDTLPSSDSKVRDLRYLPLEYIHKRALAYARLAGNKNDLPLGIQCSSQVTIQPSKSRLTSHDVSRGLRQRSPVCSLAVFGDRRYKAVTAFR